MNTSHFNELTGLEQSIQPTIAEWEEFFLKNLKEIYWAELELSEYLHGLIAAATDAELVDSLNAHLSETFGQSGRLEEIFLLMKEDPEAKRCDGIETLLDEAHNLYEENEIIRDEAIILAMQRIENFEIVTYQALIRLAKRIRLPGVVELLKENLEEEYKAQRTLNELSKHKLELE